VRTCEKKMRIQILPHPALLHTVSPGFGTNFPNPVSSSSAFWRQCRKKTTFPTPLCQPSASAHKSQSLRILFSDGDGRSWNCAPSRRTRRSNQLTDHGCTDRHKLLRYVSVSQVFLGGGARQLGSYYMEGATRAILRNSGKAVRAREQ
jgi:hypothetical protein